MAVVQDRKNGETWRRRMFLNGRAILFKEERREDPKGTSYLNQRIIIAIQRSNAASILGIIIDSF